MSPQGAILKMAPEGKKFGKMPATELAKAAGCVYVVKLSPTNIKKAAQIIRRAIYVAREVGPTFIHAYTSCNIEYSIPTEEVFKDAQNVDLIDKNLRNFVPFKALESVPSGGAQ